jgi:hypothetical protein
MAPASGYMVLAYNNNDATFNVATLSAGTDGVLGDAFTHSIAFPGAATGYISIQNITGALYVVSYGWATSLWVKSISISSGTITVIDSLRITGTSATGWHYAQRLGSSNYIALAGKPKQFYTFEMNCSTGEIGAAPIDSTSGTLSTTSRAHSFTLSDSTFQSNVSILYYFNRSTNNYNYHSTHRINRTNGDILNSPDNTTTLMMSADGPIMAVGDKYTLSMGSLRRFNLLKHSKSDGILGGSYVVTKQYAPTGFGHASMVKTGVSDSTHYMLYACAGDGSDGWLFTMSVKTDKYVAGKPGNIKPFIIDSVKVNYENISAPRYHSLTRIGTGNNFAMVYSGNGGGYIKTYSISPLGIISNTFIDSMQFHRADKAVYDMYMIHTGGNFLTIHYRSAAYGTKIATIAVTSDGMLGDALVDSVTVPGGSGSSPSNIFRVASTNYFATITGISGPAWIKMYQINTSTGEITGGGGITTEASIDSLKLWREKFSSGGCGIARIGTTDYYGIVIGGGNPDSVKLFTININSATGDIASAPTDSITISNSSGVSGGASNAIHRMGASSNYLVEANLAVGTHLAIVSISDEGIIANSFSDTYGNAETEDAQGWPIIPIGGDIYANEGYVGDITTTIYTIEADDTTGLFVPTSVNSEIEKFVYGSPNSFGGGDRAIVLSSVISQANNYQTTYIVASRWWGDGGLRLETFAILGEPDSYGWGHKIWSLVPGKIFSIVRASIAKIFGI